MMVENDWLIFLPVNVNDLFSLGDGREWLVDDLQCFKRLGDGMQLPKAAIDQYQTGHGLFLLADAFVTSRDYFPHGRKIIDPSDRLNDELAVIRFFHFAVFPHHHRSDRFRSLNVRDIEALDALRRFRWRTRVLQRP